jgi:hypothetical protein
MGRRATAAGLSACLAIAACRRAHDGTAAGKAGPPRGDAVWFTDAAAVAEPGIEDRLARVSAVAVFLPAGELQFSNGRWVLRSGPEPPRPTARPPVVLVARAGPELSAALATEGGADPEPVALALASGLEPALAAGGAYGRVIGVHLDFPFSAASAKRSGELLDALRKHVARGVFLSISAPFAPASDDARKALASLADRADALVAPVFGLEGRADASAVDALHRPWWAAYGASARGILTSASAAPGGAVPETALDALSGNPRVDFENDLSVPDASFTAFHLTANGQVRVGGLELEAGDRVSYRVPALTEMLFQLGSTLAGKRFALGRILVFGGAADAGRIFPVAAFEDVILGRSLAPVLEATVEPAGRSAISVEAVNRTPHASIPSRMSNWVEVDLSPAHPADVAPGGFDRYATYDRGGQAVTPGRATRVRFFETLVVPGEAISPARIVLRGGTPARCCPYRSHLIAAAGPEEATDWIEPPVPPTPTKKAPPAKNRKK